MYNLILITAMGVATTLGTFNNKEECMAETVNIKTSAEVSIACLPAQTPEQYEKQLGVVMKSMKDLITQMETFAERK